MSILLLNADPRVGAAIVDRLVAQGDEVRVVEDEQNPASGESWQSRGAKVARGRADDVDLVERAAQDVRTVVVMERRGEKHVAATLRCAIEAGRAAGVQRIVVCVRRAADDALRAVESSGLQYVVLRLRARGLARIVGREPSPDRIAEAIDAADDLAGEPRLDLDLSVPAGWEALRLESP